MQFRPALANVLDNCFYFVMWSHFFSWEVTVELRSLSCVEMIVVIRTTLLVIVRRALNTFIGTIACMKDCDGTHMITFFFLRSSSVFHKVVFVNTLNLWNWFVAFCSRLANVRLTARIMSGNWLMSMDTTVGCEHENNQVQLKTRWKLFRSKRKF